MLSRYYIVTNLKICFTFNSFLDCDFLFYLGESRWCRWCSDLAKDWTIRDWIFFSKMSRITLGLT